MEKRCGHCKQEKPIEMFYKNRRAKDGYDWTCKDCHKRNDAKRGGDDPAMTKKINDKKRYSGNRELILTRDERRCVICGSGDELSVHHMDGMGKGVPLNQKNNSVENLVTLCFSCHGKVHFSPDFENGRRILSNYMDSIRQLTMGE